MGTLWNVDGTTGVVNFQKKGTVSLALEQGASFPASPVTGQVFYRTDLVQFFVYDGTNWRTQAGGSLRIYNETPSGTVGSGNTIFTTATAYITGSSVVTRDGLVMKPGGVDYTETPSTGTVTFVTAPVAGSTILVSYSRTVGQDVQQLIRQDYVTGTPSGTYSGSTTVFALPFTYTTGVGSLLVYSGGVLMLAGGGNDYVETNSSTVTFNSARTAGEKIQFIKIGISADYGNSITLNSASANQLAYYNSSTNIVGNSNLTVDSGNSLTIQSQANPLYVRSTYAGDSLSGGRVGDVGLVNFWGPAGGSATKDYIGLVNTGANNSVGTPTELTEIGMVLIDNVEATATANLLFLMRGAGQSLLNGVYERLAPISNTGSYIRLGTPEQPTALAPTACGGFFWAQADGTGNNAIVGLSKDVQFGGSTTYTARGSSGGAAFIEMGRSASDDLQIYSNTSLTGGNTYTPTSRLQLNSTSITTFVPTAIKGTTTNNSASAFYVGEYIESVVGSTAAAATGTWGDATSISLTAGDWDVTAQGEMTNSGACTNCVLGISTTSGNSSTGLVAGSNRGKTVPGAAAQTTIAISVPSYRMSLASTTTVYLKHFYAFTGSASTEARLSARRVR